MPAVGIRCVRIGSRFSEIVEAACITVGIRKLNSYGSEEEYAYLNAVNSTVVQDVKGEEQGDKHNSKKNGSKFRTGDSYY